jgi:hypothetical protein
MTAGAFHRFLESWLSRHGQFDPFPMLVAGIVLCSLFGALFLCTFIHAMNVRNQVAKA